MRVILLFAVAAAVASQARCESEQAAAATKVLNECARRGESCQVTYAETSMGWLWKDGKPVNNTSTTVVRRNEVPPASSPIIIVPTYLPQYYPAVLSRPVVVNR